MRAKASGRKLSKYKGRWVMTCRLDAYMCLPMRVDEALNMPLEDEGGGGPQYATQQAVVKRA